MHNVSARVRVRARMCVCVRTYGSEFAYGTCGIDNRKTFTAIECCAMRIKFVFAMRTSEKQKDIITSHRDPRARAIETQEQEP